MTDYFVKPRAILKDSGGTAVPGAVVESVSWAVNGGWTADVTIYDPDFDTDQDRFATMKIEMDDDQGGTRSTPDMVFPQGTESDTRNTDQPGVITLQLEDLASNKLRTPNQNFPSFKATDSGVLIQTLADSVGVEVLDEPEQYITEEEVKGEAPDEAIARIRQAYAYETVVGSDGVVRFYAWEAGAADLDWDWSNRVRSFNKLQVFTGVRIGKTSSIPNGEEQIFDWNAPGFFEQELTVPLMGPFADNTLSLVGSIGSATFLDDEGGIVEHFYWAPDYALPPVGMGGSAGPATTVHVVVLPGIGFEADMAVQARLRVTGTPYSEEDPPPEGVDPEFLYPSEGTSLGAWPARGNIIEPLFPGLSYGISRHPHILDRLNSQGDTLSMNGILRVHSGLELRRRHTFRSKNYKLMQVRWDFRSARTEANLVRITSDV
jgi:hypothetical protein